MRSTATVSLIALAFLLFEPLPLRAQQPAPGSAEDLAAQGNAAFDSQNYNGAAALYEQLLKAFPNSLQAIEARYYLANSDFLLSRFDPAADLLRKLITNPAAPAEIIEQSALLLPQVLAQQATALKPDDATRKTGFEGAIKEYDAYIQKFPRNPGVETALYGRAVAAYQISNYDAAVRDLRQSLASFPRGDSFQDTQFLLSLTLATQANIALGDENASPASRETAFAKYGESEKLLEDIIAKRSDLALANDSQFQLGETFLAHALSTSGAGQFPLFQSALTAYRGVEPKEGMIAAGEARLTQARDALLAERRKAAAANPAAVRQLGARVTRESGRLAALRAKEDPVLTAHIKAGAVFYSIKRFDETRVLMTALAAEVKKPEDDKLVLYYTALSYAAQEMTDKAVAAYEKFEAKYKGDPIAENLPIIVSELFVNARPPDPARANKYLDEFSAMYPNSRLREEVIFDQANTSAAQGDFKGSNEKLDAFLKSNPKREMAAIAELKRARNLKDDKQLDPALAAFKKVRDSYKDRPEGQEAAFWVGWIDLQKKDAAGAIAELTAFQTQYPQSKLMPNVLLVLAQAQQESGAKDQALTTLTDLSARFPQSPESTSAYFARANIYLSDKKYDEMANVLTEFVDKYPANEQGYGAYERIASVQLQEKKTDAAAATYEKFLSKEPASVHAPAALSRLAALWVSAARQMGTFIALGAPQQEAWKQDVGNSIAASERQLEMFPEAPATALGLQNLLECQRLLIDTHVKTPEQVVAYFQGLADKYKDKPAARSRILFRLASLTAEKDPAKALADMKAAYDPSVVYSPADMDLYSGALLKSDPGAAAAVFDKLARDYPIPEGALPSQAPADVQEAQALVLYGRATLAQAKDDTAGAAQAFGELKKNYPRSSKVPEANLGLAESAIAKGKPDEALPLLSEVARSPQSPPAARARAMFLNGVIQDGKGQFGAIDSYLKVAAFYPTSKDAPEGLWKGAQLLEKQAATLAPVAAKPGDPTSTGQLARAKKAYQDLAGKYPGSQWVGQAKERLAALGAKS